jgi:hypothetical protein
MRRQGATLASSLRSDGILKGRFIDMLAKLAGLFHSKLALALVGAMLIGGGGAVVATGVTSHLTTAFAFHAQNGPHAEATHTASDDKQGDQESGDQDHDLNGSVTSINSAGSSFVLTTTKEDKTSSAATVKVNAATKFAGAAKSFGELKVGMRVEADGATQSDGSLLATTVEATNAVGDDEQHLAGASGSVVTVGATSFTVKGMQGTTTITVSSTTVFMGGVRRLADLKAGMHVVAIGAKQSDGSIAAQRVFVLVGSANPGGE